MAEKQQEVAIRAARHLLTWSPNIGQRLVPAFIGYTGSAKTMNCKKLAKELGFEKFHSILLGTMLPEDVLGLPKVDGEMTEYTLARWARDARDHKTLLHFDEIDKARPEVWATVLTVISDLEVHDHHFHPETRIILSGQPVEEYWLQDQTTAAVAARTVWLPLSYDYRELEKLGGLDLTWAPHPATISIPTLPCPSARQLLFLAQLRHSTDDEDVVRTVAEGVLPANLVGMYLDAKETSMVDTTSYEHMTIENAYEYLQSISPSHMSALLEANKSDAQHTAMLIRAIGSQDDNDLIETVRERVHSLLKGDVAKYIASCSTAEEVRDLKKLPKGMKAPEVVNGQFGIVCDSKFVL